MAEEILPRLDAARNREGHFTLIGDEGVDGPFARRGVVSVLVDLEPLQAGHARLSSARHFGTVVLGLA